MRRDEYHAMKMVVVEKKSSLHTIYTTAISHDLWQALLADHMTATNPCTRPGAMKLVRRTLEAKRSRPSDKPASAWHRHALLRRQSFMDLHFVSRLLTNVMREPGISWAWWSHGMEILFALHALCEGNPLITDGFHPADFHHNSV